MANKALQGSHREPFPGARVLAPADREERLEVSVLLRRRAREELASRARTLANGSAANEGSVAPSAREELAPPAREELTPPPREELVPLAREEFAARFGADPADVEAVKSFAASQGLAVVLEHLARRTVVLSGTVARFEAAFGVQLERCEHAGGTFRGRQGSIYLAPELDGIVEAVLGLDNRPQAAPHFRIRGERPRGAGSSDVLTAGGRSAGAQPGTAPGKPPARARRGGAGQSSAAAPTSFTPPQLAALYDFPDGTGTGQCVAVIELGGGFKPADLNTYFTRLGVGSPQVKAISVDHAKNDPSGDANGPDGEVMLDIEVIGAVAPQATITVYFAPNTDAGFLDAVTSAIHDTVNKPSVISISWGSAESSWTGQAVSAMDEAFQAAATLGLTVCVASGDNGSSDGAADGGDHVDFPASSAFALACGGTSLVAAGTAIGTEKVWNDGSSGGAGGGGVSTVFALPAWQAGLHTTAVGGTTAALRKRGVPDVAGDADPETGYAVRIDGVDTVIGGTSAVAPLWAGLLARINEAKGKPAGLIQPRLYKNLAALRDVTEGDNGDFSASAGWDACTGLGSPNGRKIAAAL